MTRHFYALILLFCTPSAWLYSQQYNFLHFSSKNGLTNNVVKAVAQDELGFIYFGTNNGLNKYDGSDLSSFPIPEPGNHESVYRLKNLSGNRLWINYSGNKSISWIHKGTLTHTSLHNNLYINNVYEPDRGPMLVCTDLGLFRWEKDSLIKIPLGLLNNDKIMHFAYPVGDSLLLLGRKGLPLALINRFTYKKLDEATDNISVTDIESDRSGRIWVATDSKGLTMIDEQAAKNGKIVPVALPIPLADFNAHDIFSLTWDAYNHSMIVGTSDLGVAIWKPGGVLNTITTANGLSSNTVRDVLIDRDHNWWIATSMGVDKMNADEFIFFDKMNGLNEGIVYYLQQDERRLYTWGKQNISYLTREGTINHVEYPKGVEKITLCATAVQGGFWTSVPDHLFFMETSGTIPVVRAAYPMKYLYRRLIALDNNALIMGGTENMAIWENNKLQVISDSIRDVRSMHKDKFGRIWVGTFNDGLFRIAVNKTSEGWQLKILQRYYEHGSGLNRYISIFQDREGLLWTGTRFDGVQLFGVTRDSSWRTGRVSTINGLNNNFVTSITQSTDGVMWVGTNTGFNKIEKTNGKFKISDASRNFRFNNPVNQLMADKTASIIWGATDIGLFRVKAEPEKKYRFPVYVKEIIFASKRIPVFSKDTTLWFNADENSFSINFTAPFYINEQETSYFYRLTKNNNEGKWTEVSGNRSINLISLEHGQYELEIKATAFNSNNSDTARLHFVIATPFTKSVWFIILIAVLLASLIYALYRYRLQQMMRVLKVRDSISKNLHDEIGATLSSINIYSDVARNKAEASGEIKSLLHRIYQGSGQVMENMNDIVWYVNPKNDSWENILVKMREYAAPLFEAREIHFNFDIQENILKQKMSMQERQNVYLIFKEAINNITKYALASNVHIQLHKVSHYLELVISDNGKGFDSKTVRSGNGLQNMQQRAKDIKGELKIVSEQLKGTTVSLRLRIT